MPLCQVLQPLPYELTGLPNNTLYWMTFRGKHVGISATTAEGATAFSFNGDDFAWRAEKRETVKAVPQDSAGHSLYPIRYFRFDPTDPPRYFNGGVWDVVRYTILHCSFEVDREPAQNESMTPEDDAFAESVLRQFVDLYRAAANGPPIPPLRVDHLVGALTCYSQPPYRFDETQVSGHFTNHRHKYMWRELPQQPANLDQVDGKLRRLITKGQGIPPTCLFGLMREIRPTSIKTTILQSFFWRHRLRFFYRLA
jgi:hypothetical protein